MTIDQTSGEQPAIADDIVTDVPAEAAPAVTDADESQDPKRKSGAEARISELTRLRREAERDRDYWREHATRQQPQPRAESVASDAPKPYPKLADFNYDEAAHETAVATWLQQQTDATVAKTIEQREAERQKADRQKSWKTRESEFKAKHDDYEDVAYYAPMSDAMVEIIQESDKGPELAYYLGTNKDIASRIAGMSPIQAAREIGRIEASLEKPAAPAPAPKPAVSKAPPPPPKIDAVEPAVAKDISDPNISDKEFEAIRRRQIAQRKR